MRKNRVLAGLLCIVLLFSAAFSAFAVSPQAAGDSEVVADLYLCHRWSSVPSLGHAWIYIENRSNETLQVGAYALPPNQGVSVGTFGLTRNDGSGVYYNVEAYCGHRHSLSGLVSIGTSLTRAKLSAVSNVILSQNFWDPILFNCTMFASRAWNAGGGRTVIPLLFPVMIKLQILAGSHGSVKMYNPARSQVCRQVGSGSGASLRVCCDATVSKGVG